MTIEVDPVSLVFVVLVVGGLWVWQHVKPSEEEGWRMEPGPGGVPEPPVLGGVPTVVERSPADPTGGCVDDAPLPPFPEWSGGMYL